MYKSKFSVDTGDVTYNQNADSPGLSLVGWSYPPVILVDECGGGKRQVPDCSTVLEAAVTKNHTQ